MSFRCFFITAAAFTAACGQAADAPETAAKVVSASVEHGADGAEYRLAWDTEPAGAPVRIEVSTDPGFEPGEGTLVGEFDANASVDWQADAPGVRRYFAITPDDGETVKTAVRLLPLAGGRNFRDLGGYATEDGRTVKWGRVFRSGVMAGLTDADYDYLSGLGIRTICDFRESDERAYEPTDWRAGTIDYVTFADPADSGEDPAANPMFQALLSADSTPQDVEDAMAAGYPEIAKGESEGYTVMFDRLAGGEIPLAFNCSAGKDRAGTAAALILTALGVSREAVVADYALSDEYVDYMAEFLGDEAREEAIENDYPYAFMFDLPPEKVAPLMASHPRYIESTFDAMEAEHGTVLGYIKAELDVTDEELTAIRTALLE